MKLYTQEEILNSIFSAGPSELSATMSVYKYRWKRGELSQKTIDKILTDNNFILTKPAMYKQVKTHVQIHQKSDIHIAKG